MNDFTKIQKLGLLLVLGSPVVGIVGTAWNVFAGYSAVQAVETTDISSVDNFLQMALIFSGLGVIGSVVGILLLIFGRRR